MTKICKTLILLFLLSFNLSLNAQTDDHIIWASVKVQKKINPKTSFAIAPILRLNEDISNYQNFSIDLSAKRVLGKGFSVLLHSRTWFLPDGADRRQFLWFDVAYGKSFDAFKLGSSLRMHYALDVHDNKDADFLRWKSTFTFLKLKKFSPFIAIEPWFRLNDGWELQRFRFEPGFKYKIQKQLDLVAMLRREESRNLEPSVNVNIYVITLAYTLP